MRQKLELTWIGKENRPKLEPRIFGLPRIQCTSHPEGLARADLQQVSEQFHTPAKLRRLVVDRIGKKESR